MSIINVAIVDDNKLFLRALAVLVKQIPEYHILFEAKNIPELAEKASRKLKPKVILADVSLSLKDNGCIVQMLADACPDAGIITYSMEADQEQVMNLTQKGVKGYLPKNADFADFRAALETVSSGGYYYPAFVTGYLVKQFNSQRNINYKQQTLNKRELEFLKLSGSELTYKEIAVQMCVSARTVDGYRDTLFEKLNVKSRVGLVLYAIKNNLVNV